jgi:hypothetical protein
VPILRFITLIRTTAEDGMLQMELKTGKKSKNVGKYSGKHENSVIYI